MIDKKTQKKIITRQSNDPYQLFTSLLYQIIY